MNSNSSGHGLEGFLTGKGFYIVLFLCAAVIGLSLEPRVETVLVTPDIQAPKLEVMAVPDEPAEEAEPVMEEITEEEEALPVWSEADAAVTYWPVEGELERLHDVEHLHYDVTLRDWRTHEGVDILAPLGETVCAAMSGVVMNVEEDGLYGTVVTVDHGDGTQAVYANLASIPAVNPGDWIMAGDVIGAVGTTALCEIGQGTHLHFAMYLDGQSVDPLDYLPV